MDAAQLSDRGPTYPPWTITGQHAQQRWHVKSRAILLDQCGQAIPAGPVASGAGDDQRVGSESNVGENDGAG
jgi:hypothetical protein